MVALARNPKRTPVCTSIDNSPVPHVPCATFVACYICSVVASPIRSIDENDALVCYASNTLARQALSGPLLACVRMIATAVAMPDPIDPVALASDLIRCPSVTPARGEVFDVLEQALTPLGFTVHRWVMGEVPDGPTENMVAIRGESGPHFGFAGHLDVVPSGEGWNRDPFAAEI